MDVDDFMSFSPARGRARGQSSSPAEGSSRAGGGDRVLWGPSKEALLAKLPQLRQPAPLPLPVPQPVANVKRTSGTAGLGSPTRPQQQQQSAEAARAAAAARLAKRQRRSGRQSSSTGCLVFGQNNTDSTAASSSSTMGNGRSQSADIDRDALLAVLETRLNNRELEQQAAAASKRRSLPEGKAVLGAKPTVSVVMEETDSQSAAAESCSTDAQMSQGVAQISLKTSSDEANQRPKGSQGSDSRAALAAKSANGLPLKSASLATGKASTAECTTSAVPISEPIIQPTRPGPSRPVAGLPASKSKERLADQSRKAEQLNCAASMGAQFTQTASKSSVVPKVEDEYWDDGGDMSFEYHLSQIDTSNPSASQQNRARSEPKLELGRSAKGATSGASVADNIVQRVAQGVAGPIEQQETWGGLKNRDKRRLQVLPSPQPEGAMTREKADLAPDRSPKAQSEAGKMTGKPAGNALSSRPVGLPVAATKTRPAGLSRATSASTMPTSVAGAKPTLSASQNRRGLLGQGRPTSNPSDVRTVMKSGFKLTIKDPAKARAQKEAYQARKPITAKQPEGEDAELLADLDFDGDQSFD